jgi:gamma-glutamyltranspeptidase / glutathione hydrolase
MNALHGSLAPLRARARRGDRTAVRGILADEYPPLRSALAGAETQTMRLTIAVVAALMAAPVAAAASTANGARGAVATDQAIASQVGLSVLQAKGNAVDAAIAIAYTLAVTYPSAGNIGGGGFMMIRLIDGTARFIDFREVAPSAATPKMYQDGAGHVVPERSTIGALAVAVPGTVAGLELARDRYGTRSRHELMSAAIALADEGFKLSDADAQVFAANGALLARFPSTAAIYTHNGTPFRAGETLRQPALAKTLRAIDRDGVLAFYTGDVGRRFAAAVQTAGGIITPADLTAYKVEVRAPVECVHRGHRLFTSPPPSSGGVAICETLGILGDTLTGASRSVTDAHREIEAERRAFADRSTTMGDPGFVKLPVAQLLAPAYLAQQRELIVPNRATPSSAIKGMPIDEGTNTTNFSVVDAAGNAVDVTYTLNSTFGSGLVAGDTGVLLNNEMDDFASAPGVPNQFGLVQGAANAIAPHKRPLSSMAPTIVVDQSGRVSLVAGASGGPRIITTTMDILRGALDFGQDAGTAMNAPRVHHQWLPDVVYAEPGAFTDATAAALTGMGYTIKIGPMASSANAIVVGPDGTRVAAHDDRRPTGAALAY